MSNGIDIYEVRVYGYEEGVLEEYKTLRCETFRGWGYKEILEQAKSSTTARIVENPTYEIRMVVEFQWEKINE